jgi:DNA-directed RNA polymerase subunit M/transcription elongation factor TFIIS
MTMKFCDNCSNMYYIHLDENDNDKLIYFCRNCGNKDTILIEERVCVLDTQLKKGVQQFNHIINKYTKLDPTLPRIYNIKCPNTNCITNIENGDNENGNNPAEIIYMRYDDINMKYLYICVSCDNTWKTDDKK